MKSKYGLFAILFTLMLAFSNSNYLHTQEAAVVDTPAVEIREVEAPPEAVSGDAPMLLRDDELDSLLNEPVNSRAVVGPLVRQKWNQYAPYNDLFPFIRGHPKDDGTGRLYTNCTNTAWAQIMAFHRHPARGSGQSTVVGPNHNVTVSSVNLNVAYDWNNMLNSYRRDGTNSNERQRNAVAVLMYHVALAVGAQGNYYTAMTETFGYDRSIQRHERIFYTDAGWEALIRSQLDAGLPVYYSAGRDGGGHGFVVDGYDNQGKFHVNWGWGGGHDGWYSLNALTPGNRNYYLRHSITTNIRPNQRSTGSHEMGIKGFTVNKTAIQQNELFTVTANVTSFGFFSGGQVGAAVVNTIGAITSIVGIANYGERRPGSSLTRTMNCFLPETVSPGIGNLRIVTRETGGEWKIAAISAVGDGVPSAINLTVTAGTVTPGGGYGLALTAFNASKNTAAQNELFTVTMIPRNVGLEQFPGGQVGAALVDNSGRIAEVIGTRNRSALNAGSLSGALEFNCYVPETVRAGQYRLMAVVRPEGGQWRVATLALPDIPNSIDFNVTAETITPGGGYGLALTAFNASKNTVAQNEMFAVTIVPRNVGLVQFPGGQVGAALVGTNGRIVEVIGIRNRSALNAGSLSGALEFNCYVPETVRAGQYRLMAVVRPEGGQWRVATLALPDVPNSINFTVNAERGTTGGGYGLALTSFTSSMTSVRQNERFTVTVTPRNVGLEQFPGGQVGAALVDNNGRIVEVIGTRNRSALNAGSLSSALEFNCTVPNTVRAGQYRLMAVIRPSGGEWRIATLALPDIPTGIDFTVTGTAASQPAAQPTTQPTAQQPTAQQPAAQQTLAANAPATITINNGQRVQFSFTAPSAGIYIIESTNNGSLDPVAYSASSGTGSAAIINDDGGEGRNFQFAQNLSTGEVFTFFAGVHRDNGTGSYTINVQGMQSVSLALNTPAAVTINNGQRVQFSFTAPSAGTYTFESSNNGSLDPVAFSASIGTTSSVIINDDGGQGRNFRFTRNLLAGEVFTFFAGVFSNRGSGSYTVNVQGSR